MCDVSAWCVMWLMCLQEKWEEGFYITAMAGSMSSASLVVMSKGTPYTQQSYKVSGAVNRPRNAAPLLMHPPMWRWSTSTACARVLRAQQVCRGLPGAA